LFNASHWPPKPLNTLFVFTGPYSARPLTSNIRPFFVKIAIREFTVTTT
jgi:hypothetical protein